MSRDRRSLQEPFFLFWFDVGDIKNNIGLEDLDTASGRYKRT